MIAELRDATRQSHHQLENLPLTSRLMSSSVTPADYLQVLQRALLAHRRVEPQILHHLDQTDLQQLLFAPREALIVSDIRQLCSHIEVQPDDPVDDAALQTFYQLHDTGEALGACYVLQGSLLGGNIIRRHLQKAWTAIPPPCKFRYHGIWAQDTAEKWRVFCRTVQQLADRNNCLQHNINQGAIKTFELFLSLYETRHDIRPNRDIPEA